MILTIDKEKDVGVAVMVSSWIKRLLSQGYQDLVPGICTAYSVSRHISSPNSCYLSVLDQYLLSPQQLPTNNNNNNKNTDAAAATALVDYEVAIYSDGNTKNESFFEG
jgi:hypothetical protein